MSMHLPHTPTPTGAQVTTAQSNSLADLAARIRAEHEATDKALKSSVAHGITAGELLIEAKEKVPHGQWLPWLKENCAISERTAQLYMRLAKNRANIEDQIRNDVADLTLNETAALLMLTSDVRKLINFARDLEHLPADQVMTRCIAEGVACFHDPSYNPLAGRTDAEILEWHLFILFMSFDAAAGRSGGEPAHVSDHVEWVLQRPFQNVAEWLGEEGDRFRKPYGGQGPSDQFKADWATFLNNNRQRELSDVVRELQNLQQQFQEARAAGRLQVHRRKRQRKREAKKAAA